MQKLFFLLILLSGSDLSAQQNLLLLSDADQTPQTFFTGKTEQKENVRDSLTVLQFDPTGTKSGGGILLSNSLTARGKIAAYDRERKVLYVIQTRGELADTVQIVENLFTDLPTGKTIVAVDVSDPADLSPLDTLTVGRHPNSVALSPDGNFLAVTVEEKHSEILRIQLKPDGTFGNVFRHPHAVYNQAGNIRATDIAWHPAGKHFAVILEEEKSLAFYKMIETSYGTRSALLGAPVVVDSFPRRPRFSADGAFCYVLNAENAAGKGEILGVKFDEGGNHDMSFTLETDFSPQNMTAVGADLFAVTTRKSPTENEAEILLLSFSAKNGFTLQDRAQFSAKASSNLAFDAQSGRLFFVLHSGKGESALHFLQIGADGKLSKSTKIIAVRSGVHGLFLR